MSVSPGSDSVYSLHLFFVHKVSWLESCYSLVISPLSYRPLDASFTCCVLNSTHSRRGQNYKSSMGNTPSLKMMSSTPCITTSYVRIIRLSFRQFLSSCHFIYPSVLTSCTPHFSYCPLGSMLKVNPEERLSITELVNQLQEIAAARNVNPKSPITEVGGCTAAFRSVAKEESYREAARESSSRNHSYCRLKFKKFSFGFYL